MREDVVRVRVKMKYENGTFHVCYPRAIVCCPYVFVCNAHITVCLYVLVCYS